MIDSPTCISSSESGQASISSSESGQATTDYKYIIAKILCVYFWLSATDV